MAKTKYVKLQGSQSLRLRLLLSTLSSTPILIDDIRSNHTIPGLRPHEVSFLRLIETVCDDCTVEINETGTALYYPCQFKIVLFIFYFLFFLFFNLRLQVPN